MMTFLDATLVTCDIIATRNPLKGACRIDDKHGSKTPSARSMVLKNILCFGLWNPPKPLQTLKGLEILYLSRLPAAHVRAHSHAQAVSRFAGTGAHAHFSLRMYPQRFFCMFALTRGLCAWLDMKGLGNSGTLQPSFEFCNTPLLETELQDCWANIVLHAARVPSNPWTKRAQRHAQNHRTAGWPLAFCAGHYLSVALTMPLQLWRLFRQETMGRIALSSQKTPQLDTLWNLLRESVLDSFVTSPLENIGKRTGFGELHSSSSTDLLTKH